MKIRRNTLLPIAALMLSFIVISCENDDSDAGDGISNDILANDYVMVASGQTALYDNDGEVISSLLEGDALYGQDASYLMGEEMSFTNNGDSTVTDNNTGLMWEEIPIPDALTYEEAIAYCEDLVLAGYDDWRIPSLKELFSISDFGLGWPYLDTTYFKLATGVVDKSEQFWSSNRYVGVTTEGQDNAAFGVNHVTGHIKAYPARSMEGGVGGTLPPDGEDPGDGTLPPEGEDPGDGTLPPDGEDPGDGIMPPAGEEPGDGTLPPAGEEPGVSFNPLAKHVRAVRGDTYGINDFEDNGDGTITDNETGLMWTQADNGEGIDWEDALAYAENAEIAGYSDWRLPNVKELQGIVDYSYSINATEAANVGPAIDPIFSVTSIVSEAGYDDYPYFWTGTSANFTSGEPYYYAWYVAFGRAVDGTGEDSHGAGAVRFDTKYEGGPLGEGGERFYNFVRLVRD